MEACIALSIVLVAGEALHARETLARRWPALVAFLFGLVHGLGFAGALKEIGLPRTTCRSALLTFNVGVEIGQLLTVGAAWLLWRASSRWPALAAAAHRRCSTASARWRRGGRGCASSPSSADGDGRSRRPVPDPVPARAGDAAAPRWSTALVELFSDAARVRDNNSSANLSHTEMLRPGDSPLLGRGRRPSIAPKLVDFGAQLFGERLALVDQGDVGQRARHRRPPGDAQPRQQLRLGRRLPDADAPVVAARCS